MDTQTRDTHKEAQQPRLQIEKPAPACRPDLVFSPLGNDGRYVVKDRRSGEFYTFGEQEQFLLERLDGEQTAEDICTAFEDRFGEPLSSEELDGFVEMAAKQGLLEERRSDNGAAGAAGAAGAGAAAGSEAPERGPPGLPFAPAPATLPRKRQSVLYWRKSFFDPDRLFTWLQPKVWFFWTPAFVVFSAACILSAACVAWANAAELISYFPHVLHWGTLIAVWLTMALVTTCHEFAHGLTCKRYGGEVHEIGFLLIFLMPAFYCNVSDAWLFREKSKRLWVTAAGGYFELFLWALAMFAWRLTVQDSLLNYLAWVVLSITGIRVFFNFNPLIKLDGYYLLSDLIEMPNMRQRSLGYTMSHLRWLLWGAPRPTSQARGRFLLGFGVASWLFSILFLGLILFAMTRWLQTSVGLAGLLAGGILGIVVMGRMFGGASNGEVTTMIRTRKFRTLCWGTLLASILIGPFLIPMPDWAGGPFEVRPLSRAELRAPVAGFLTGVHIEEGEQISEGQVVVRLEAPDLDSRIARLQAQVREAEAKLQLLQEGTRLEEIAEQRRRVQRAEDLRDRAQGELERRREALKHELARLEERIAQYEAEVEVARDALDRAEEVLSRKAVSEVEYQEKLAALRVARAQRQQAAAEKRAAEAIGTLEAEAQLALREKELAEQRGKLALMEAGSRPGEIAAAEAHLDRLREELDYLRQQQEKLPVCGPIAGVMTTPRLQEKIGQYFEEGDLICEIEQCAIIEAEIALDEDHALRVRPEQRVTLKARSLPFETFQAEVTRVAPRATDGEMHSTVSVYCRVENSDLRLRPAMTGYARITCGRRSAGEILIDRALRFLRTEFWW